MTSSEFARAFDVSRETCRRLEAYVDLLRRWNVRINLVSQTTLDAIWLRHIADSAQLLPLAPPDSRSWVDLGSGAGFPGIPVAVIAAEKAPDVKVTVIESDARKAAFLTTVARELDLALDIVVKRIESVAPEACDVVSARALAPLDRLCSLAYRFKGPSTVFLFPKGARLDWELTEARRHWHIRAERIASRTDAAATILQILELEPRP